MKSTTVPILRYQDAKKSIVWLCITSRSWRCYAVHFDLCEDPENIYKMVIEAGAEIIDKLAEFQFGGRTFSCKDIESNVWIFTSHNPWGKFW